MKKIILSMLGLLLFQSVYSQGTANIDWNNDLDFLAKQLSGKHYNLFATRSEKDFLRGIDAIKAGTDHLTDWQIALKIQQLIAGMGDSHTSLDYSRLVSKNEILPLGLHWLSDGLYIIKTTRENKELLGTRLLSVNETPIATVIDSLSTLFTADNQAILKNRVPQLIPSYQILNYFGFAADRQVKLKVRTRSGEDKTYTIEPALTDRAGIAYFTPDSLPFYLKNQKVFFIESYQPQDKIYYILYNKCNSKEVEAKYGNKEKAKEMPSFAEFEKRVFQALNKEAVDKIIVDLRLNGGGNSMQGTSFIEKLSSFLKTKPGIKLYVVIGRSTFSSAILNAMDFKRLTNAVFIGEETAGKPNHFGEVKSFRLPGSKLSVNYSTKYFKESDEDVSTLAPDVLIELGFSDFSKGIDPVYEWVRKQ